MRGGAGLLRAVSYRAVLRFLAAGLQALALVVLARDLGAGGFGEFVVGVTVGAVLSGVTGLGVPTRALRVFLEDRSGALSAAMVNYSLVAAALTGGLVLGGMAATQGLGLLAWSAAAVVASDQFVGAAQAVLAGRQRQLASANLILGQRVAPVLGLAAAGWWGRPTIAGYAAGALLYAVGAGIWLVQPRAGIGLGRLRRGALGYVLTSLTGLMANLDASVVRMLAGPAAAGVYGAATRLVSPLSIVVSTLLTVLVPHAAQQKQRDVRAAIFAKALRVVAVMSALLAALSVGIAEAVSRVLGDGYPGVRSVVISVVIGVALSAVSQVFQAEMVTEGRAVVAASLVGAGTAFGLAALGVAVAVWGGSVTWLGPLAMQASVLLLLWLGRHRARPRAPRNAQSTA